MEELQDGPDFLGVKLKYWAPLMTQYQQAKRSGQLTADSQGIPLIVRSGTSLDLKYNVKIEEIDAAGKVVKEVGTATRSLGKDYLPFVSKDPFALSWPGSTDHSGLLGSAGNFNQGLYTRLRGAPTSLPLRSTRTATPRPMVRSRRPPFPATGSP
ncbi:conserved hypothetical protein [Arthrobacter sp. Hiyo4]|nr:conserved hypothetical protein [Arthrobacter sp. Hiyo4]